MNAIKNIEIKNFKSIRHQKIEDCRRINVFVGYPNVGKSNILEAISLFGVNEQVRLKDLVRLKEIPTIFFNGLISNDLMVSLNNEYGIFGNYSGNAFSLQIQDSGGDGSIQNIRTNPALDSSVKTALSFTAFDSVPGLQIFQGRKPKQDISIKKYEFKKDIATYIGNYSVLQYPFGNNIFSILQTHKVIQRDATELFNEYALELLYDSREQEFTILKRTDSGIFTVPYELVADTLQRLIFYKAAICSNKDAVLLFEEPEAHMFPPYISKFTSDIWYYKDNQYFISTQSPFVVNDFMENMREELAIYTVEYEKGQGETIIKRLTEEQIHEAYQFGIDIFFNLESITK